MGNRGGWQVARALFLLNVLTGSVGTEGGTALNSWNKFVPKPFSEPPATDTWNELHLPHEWPFAHYEMSFLLPHFLDEGRGSLDVYFTRVYNPMWINPDGFLWLEALRDESKIKCHVALTPTWNESAWFADYVLPMGHAGERHDLMSQETHASAWIGFRQPVRRVAMERAGKKVRFTYEANPGEVWEENEFWSSSRARWIRTARSASGSDGEPDAPGELITQDEYWTHIFEHSVPGLPEAAAKEGLTPLAYMRKYGAFEVKAPSYRHHDKVVSGKALRRPRARDGLERQAARRAHRRRAAPGLRHPSGSSSSGATRSRSGDGPSSSTWSPGRSRATSRRRNIDRQKGEMILLPNFRLPNLIHTRSANSKWLYEISHANPIWVHPQDAARIGVETGALVRVETEIGWFVGQGLGDRGIKPGIVAMSHHLGRWRLQDDLGGNKGTTALAQLAEDGKGGHKLELLGGAQAWTSTDADTSRIWWTDVGVHQNLTHAVQPDPLSGAHCWLQKVGVDPEGGARRAARRRLRRHEEVARGLQALGLRSTRSPST
jgi:anaerobic selenocysteine-containing dehydrogenase